MTEPISNRDAFLVGIDPDSKKSGVAVWRRHDKRYALHNFEFFELFDFLVQLKSEIRLVVIEAGWLNKSVWHGAHGKGAAISAKVGKNVGANHETGKKILEMCVHLKIHYELVRPAKRSRGKGKILADEFQKLTGIHDVTNQEKRDAFMLVFGR